MTNAARIFITKQDDGSFIAVSIETPRFGVGAATEEEVCAKALRAFEYYHANKHKVLSLKASETRVVTPAFDERVMLSAGQDS